MKSDEALPPQCQISIRDVSLLYDLYYDKTNTLKEYVVNFLHKRRFVEKRTDKLHALDNLSLEINHGERVGIIGLNGSGKSTLLKVIAGILKPTRGDVFVQGSVQPLIEIGAGFNPEFSGRENIYLNAYMLGFSKEQVRQKEKEIIEFTELGEFIDVPIKYYSSGMAVRLAFTIATTISPEILVFDEMLSAGDLEFMEKARKRMDNLLNSAKMLVIVSHDLNLIRSLTRRVIVLSKGKIVYDGPSDSGVQYYTDMIANNLEAKLAHEGGARQAVQQGAPIELESVKVANSVSGSAIIPPGEALDFDVTFATRRDFSEFFVNMTIFDRTGPHILHFRNDLSGYALRDFKQGTHRFGLHVNSLSLRSERYKCQFRLVGRNGNDDVIVDSEKLEFEITGSQPAHQFVKHHWEIQTLNR